jgi:hypothetical protein
MATMVMTNGRVGSWKYITNNIINRETHDDQIITTDNITKRFQETKTHYLPENSGRSVIEKRS